MRGEEGVLVSDGGGGDGLVGMVVMLMLVEVRMVAGDGRGDGGEEDAGGRGDGGGGDHGCI